MKYLVAAGVCYTHNGKNYVEGDEITKDIFNPKELFDKAINEGKIIAVGKAEAKVEESVAEASADKVPETEPAEPVKPTGKKKAKKSEE